MYTVNQIDQIGRDAMTIRAVMAMAMTFVVVGW